MDLEGLLEGAGRHVLELVALVAGEKCMAWPKNTRILLRPHPPSHQVP